MSYTEPWVLGTGADVTLAAEHETEDTLTARTSLSLGGVVTARSRVMVTLETGLDMVTDAATDLKARTVWAGTGVAHDTRDFPANPRSGMRAWLSTRAGTRQADSGSAGLVSRVRAGLTGLEPLGRVLALFGNAAAQAVFSVADLGRAELPGLGGAGSVRGFREHEFRSGRAVWLNIETRLVPDRGTRVYPFFDCGAFEEQGRWRVISGYGAGARAATRVGVLGVDYGVAAGESLLRGKVHISYEGSFQ
jgi:hemolysin activation/secretion protein